MLSGEKFFSQVVNVLTGNISLKRERLLRAKIECHTYIRGA